MGSFNNPPPIPNSRTPAPSTAYCNSRFLDVINAIEIRHYVALSTPRWIFASHLDAKRHCETGANASNSFRSIYVIFMSFEFFRPIPGTTRFTRWFRVKIKIAGLV